MKNNTVITCGLAKNVFVFAVDTWKWLKNETGEVGDILCLMWFPGCSFNICSE